MAIDMRKTPSYLKGLAETRARVAGDLQRYEKQHPQLEVKLKAAKADLERCQRLYTGVCRGLAEAKADLESCDRLIHKFDDRLDPEQIVPIQAWKGRYGKRGGLKEMMSQFLKDLAPVATSTPELAQAFVAEFHLEFATVKELKAWTHNSVGRSLKGLVMEGLVERLHDPKNLLGRCRRQVALENRYGQAFSWPNGFCRECRLGCSAGEAAWAPSRRHAL